MTNKLLTCYCLATADDPHVAVVAGEDEPAADAHVEAGHNHDDPGHQAPEHQEVQGPRNYKF